jgi:hypothetical protein
MFGVCVGEGEGKLVFLLKFCTHFAFPSCILRVPPISFCSLFWSPVTSSLPSVACPQTRAASGLNQRKREVKLRFSFVITLKEKGKFDSFRTVMNPMYIKTKLRGFSPQAIYTDRATAACRRSYCHTCG